MEPLGFDCPTNQYVSWCDFFEINQMEDFEENYEKNQLYSICMLLPRNIHLSGFKIITLLKFEVLRNCQRCYVIAGGIT